MLNKSEEWCVGAPWGKIACVSWGNPERTPVVMVHGYMDTAATFIPLLQYLPDTHYYVAIDLPGHGKSDAFPVGMLKSHVHQVYTLEQVIKHLKWEKFIYISHSLGFIIGVIYNYINPFKITKMVNLDPVPLLSTYCFQEYSPTLWYQFLYDDYYENFSKWELQRTKLYTYEQAVDTMARNRKLSKEKSAVVLSRALIPDGDMYRLSWEPTMRRVVPPLLTEASLTTMVTTNAPPMLSIVASEDNTLEMFKGNGIRFMMKFQESIHNFTVINVQGHHDVHITNPETFVDKIIDFLNCDNRKSKL